MVVSVTSKRTESNLFVTCPMVYHSIFLSSNYRTVSFLRSLISYVHPSGVSTRFTVHF
uniref:Uncharacterized protein n=1 Tax=Anguilla anguilla TaxID=7936 RepID=A0A0E9WIE0_ANGAN